MNKYTYFYNDKQGEVEAETSYKAQQKVADFLKVSNKNRYKITIVLCEVAELDGNRREVTHIADI